MVGMNDDQQSRTGESAEIAALRARLQEAEETLRAIRGGEIDALVVEGPPGPMVYTLVGAEHPYRRMVEQMSEGAVTTTTQGTVLYCNRRFAAMLHMPLERVIGASVYTFLTGAGRTEFDRLLATDLEHGATAELTLVPGAAGGGTPPAEIPVYMSASRLEVEGVAGVCLIVTDLSAQKRQEAILETGRQKLAEEQLKANKLESLGMLAGGLAHDLNNTLTAVLGNIGLARKQGGDDPVLHQRLANAERACLQARNVTQQLLVFAKGGAPLKKPVDLRGRLQEWTAFALAGSNARCTLDVAADLWPVEVDEGQIGRVLNNLLINAQQAMPAGGLIRVAAGNWIVDAQARADGMPLTPGRYVQIAVEDTGRGIPAEQLPKIFDPYFTTKRQGSGLGLSVAYSVIRSHAGHIAVESEPGVGSRFSIYLPASTHAASRRPPRPQVVPPGLRVLVMDDQEAIRALIGEVVRDEGGAAEFADDGAAALAVYEQALRAGRPFDVVLMDLTIPGGMGGQETIGRLLELDPQARAIVFSGYSNDAIMADYGKYGFSAVLPKPFEIDALLTLLGEVGRPEPAPGPAD